MISFIYIWQPYNLWFTVSRLSSSSITSHESHCQIYLHALYMNSWSLSHQTWMMSFLILAFTWTNFDSFTVVAVKFKHDIFQRFSSYSFKNRVVLPFLCVIFLPPLCIITKYIFLMALINDTVLWYAFTDLNLQPWPAHGRALSSAYILSYFWKK